ncbi:hypothetical protein BWI17_18170 [Betaproteobacteria bacterium GR16-43]|nr:hypothetical protein BWI17_18170 [Betaproteobacteria bacterium GR16-43]
MEERFAAALALHRAGRLDEAERLYAEIVAAQPRHANALAMIGTLHADRGRPDEAVRWIDRALEIDPAQAFAWLNRGNALHGLGRPAEALASYDRSLALAPQDAQAWSHRSVALGELRQQEESLASAERATVLAPQSPDAWNHRAMALAALGRTDEAIAAYDRAVALHPGHAPAHANRASALLSRLRFPEALASIDRALALAPRFAAAHLTRGSILKELARYTESLASYEDAARLAPGLPYLDGTRLFLKMQLCDWTGIDALYRQVEAGIERGRPACHPFALLSMPASAALQRRCAEIFVAHRHPATGAPAPARHSHDRIRIGYFSADFHDHATAYLAAELFELHDRARFEIHAFSFGIASQGAVRQRLVAGFDHFHEVAAMPDAEVAALARRLEIDIAVDLKGFTQDARPGIFAHRAAPVQASFLGYPGTMGAPYIDYVIADPVVLPPAHEAHYSENVIRLPHCYQPNDRRRSRGETVSRGEAGLPATGFVFCCFNNTFKLTPEALTLWARLLAKVEGSVLWLLKGEPIAMENLRREAAARGVDPERLVFAPRRDLAAHLSRLRHADVVLDTFRYGAHTTASDALWVGVPVVTCRGETFASRVAASLLEAVGLPELVTDTPEAYEALALELATKPAALAAVREKLTRRDAQPLFDTPRYARDLEAAYSAMIPRQVP